MKFLHIVWTVLLTLGMQQNPANGSITGKLKLPNGEPIAGVRVAAMAVSDIPGQNNSAPTFVSITESGSDGSYKLEDIPPGRYYLTAGIMSALTYYPGGFDVVPASILSITAGRALSGYDFTPGAFIVSVKGRIVMTGPPGVPLPSVIKLSGSDSVQAPIGVDGSFEMRRVFPGVYAVSTEPEFSGTAGNIVIYEQKTINGSSTPKISIESVSPQNLIVTIEAARLPNIQFSLEGRVANAAIEAPSLAGQSIRISSLIPGLGTVEASIKPDNTFEFGKVPAGVYRASVGSLRALSPPPTITLMHDMTDAIVDLKNNPFPEYPGGSYAAVFSAGNPVTIQGVITQAVTQIRAPAPVHYFRMDVKDAASGTVTPWAIMLTNLAPPSLMVGETVVVIGSGSRDGTHRLSVDNSGQNIGSISRVAQSSP